MSVPVWPGCKKLQSHDSLRAGSFPLTTLCTPLCFDISCSAYRAEASGWKTHKRLNPLYYAAFINSRGPRSGVATGDPICTAYKVSSN